MRLDRSRRRQSGFGPVAASAIALLAIAAMLWLVLWKLFQITG
ncbi:hypothetical protein [uncultured Sphingomonas sp.]|nr:hypothetical protein [uncultured Sphingomonas sp.]